VAVENDYNLLLYNLNELAKELTDIQSQVRARLQEEKREQSEPNATNWVNLIALRFPIVSGLASNLEEGARTVLSSRPGEAVFHAEPPQPPETV
jgi:hypothetical protein